MSEYDNIVSHCIEKILSNAKRPLIVAVTGESGSGKSFFTRILQEEMTKKGVNFAFVNHDDFLIPRAQREALRNHVYEDGQFKGRSKWEILENWYYLDDFHDLIVKLKNRQTASYYPYIHNGGIIGTDIKTVSPEEIILMENKLFLNEMDIVIELRVDRAKIIERKIKRDSDVRTPEQTIEMHERAQGYYWDRNRPQGSHIVIDNNDYNHPKLIEG